MLFVERFHIVECGLAHMTDIGTDGRPAVGVDLVAEWSQQQPHIAIGLVHIPLVKLLGDNLLLHLEGLLADVEVRHPVGFESQGCGKPVGGESHIIVRVVAVGERVALAAHRAHHSVEVGHRAGAAEHQVLEQVGKTGAAGVLVARADPIEQVHGGQRCIPRFVGYHRQTVVQYMFSIFYHRAR